MKPTLRRNKLVLAKNGPKRTVAFTLKNHVLTFNFEINIILIKENCAKIGPTY